MSMTNENQIPQTTPRPDEAESVYGQNPAASGAGVAGNETNRQFQAATQAETVNSQPLYAQDFSQTAFQHQGQAPQNNFGQYQEQPKAPYQTQSGYQFQQQTYAQNPQYAQQNWNPSLEQQPAGPYGSTTETGPNDHGQNLKHDGNMFQNGQLLDVLDGIMKGNPDVQKISGLLSTTNTQFWKGAAIGAGAALILGNAAVQSAMVSFFNGVLNKKTTKKEDPK